MWDLALTAQQAMIFLLVALPVCVWAVYSDVKEFKIKNTAVLTLLVGFVVLGPFALDFSDYLWRYSHFAVVIAVGFGLWVLGGIGAGDVKLAAAFAPYIAAQDVGSVFFIWLLAMVAMALGYSRRAYKVAQADGLVAARKMPIPFGIALAPTLIIYLVLGLIHGGS